MPSTEMVPESGRARLPIRLSSVLLPQPDGPVSDTNSPGSSRRLASRTATMRLSASDVVDTTSAPAPGLGLGRP